MTYFQFNTDKRGSGKRMGAQERALKTAAAVKLAGQGLSREMIGERLGVSTQCASRMLQNAGAPRLPRGDDRYKLANMRDKLIGLWADGMSASQIAVAVGATRNAVIGYVHRNRDVFPARMTTVRKQRLTVPKVPKVARLSRAFSTATDEAKTVVLVGAAPALDMVERQRGKSGAALVNGLFQLSGGERADGSVREGVALADLKHGACRWPVNAAATGIDCRFCGGDAREGKPYCAAHEAFAYTTQAEANENYRRYKERQQSEMRNKRAALVVEVLKRRAKAAGARP